MTRPGLFDDGNLPWELVDNLRGLNPHWEGKPGPPLPHFRRWIFTRLQRLFTSGLTPAVVLRGPRRVGKTVLLRQLLEQLLADGTLLIRLVEPLELRLKRRKSRPKICLSDHVLRAAWLQEIVPLDPLILSSEPHLYDLAGHMAESTLGYFLASIPNLDLAHFPERGAEPEVDFILTVGTRRKYWILLRAVGRFRWRRCVSAARRQQWTLIRSHGLF